MIINKADHDTVQMFESNARAACAQAASALCTLNNLTWRDGKIEGPSRDVALFEVKQEWIDAMRELIHQADDYLLELETANDSIQFQRKFG